MIRLTKERLADTPTSGHPDPSESEALPGHLGATCDNTPRSQQDTQVRYGRREKCPE